MLFNRIWHKEQKKLAKNILFINAIVQLLWAGYGVYSGISIGRGIFNFVGSYMASTLLLWVVYGFLFTKKTIPAKP